LNPPLVHPASETDLACAFADDDRLGQEGFGRLTQCALGAVVGTNTDPENGEAMGSVCVRLIDQLSNKRQHKSLSMVLSSQDCGHSLN
jgi:hypothetical protein